VSPAICCNRQRLFGSDICRNCVMRQIWCWSYATRLSSRIWFNSVRSSSKTSVTVDYACLMHHLYWSISQNPSGVPVYKLTHRNVLQHCVKHTTVLLPDKECWLCYQQRATVTVSNTLKKRRSPVRYHTVNGFKQSLHAPAVKYLLNNFPQKYLLKKH